MSGANTDQERVEVARKEYAKIKLEEVVRIPTEDEKEKTIGTVSQITTKPTSEQSFINIFIKKLKKKKVKISNM